MTKRRLGDICNVVSGSTPKTNVEEFWDGDIKWITPAELTEDSYVLEDSARKITELAVEKTGLNSFPKGTVILSSRAPIGKVAIAGCEMYCNQGFKNLICTEEIYNEYLYWFLKSKKDYLNSLGRGATFKEISKSIVENIEVEVPKVEVQKEIAYQLQKCREILALRRKELFELDQLIKSRFVEMFGNKGVNPNGYDEDILGNLYRFQYGKGNNIPEDKGEYPCYGSNGIVGHHTEFNSEDAPIIGHIGAYAGIVNWGAGKHYVTYNGVICKLKTERINPIYGFYLLQQQDFNRVATKGGGQPFVSYGDLESPMVVVPPIEVQNAYATFATQVDKLKVEVKKSLDETQQLMDSLMQKYFG